MTTSILMAGAAVQTDVATTRSLPGGVRISVAGGLETGVAYLLDGADHNNQQKTSTCAAVPRRAAGVPRRDERPVRAERRQVGGVGQCGDEVGHQPLPGNAFEFLRAPQFNATNPFAALGPDGKRVDDGLKRNQFGGTLGGPIVRDRLFFFGAYQGTATRTTPASEHRVRAHGRRCWPATSRRSPRPQCNGGRQVTLRAPFVNNRIDPARFSPAAIEPRRPAAKDDRPVRPNHLRVRRRQQRASVRRARRLPADAGSSPSSAGTWPDVPAGPGFAGGDDNVLEDGRRSAATLCRTSLTLGDTSVFGSSTVNSSAVHAQQVEGRQLSEAVLLSDGYRRQELPLLRAGVHGR